MWAASDFMIYRFHDFEMDADLKELRLACCSMLTWAIPLKSIYVLLTGLWLLRRLDLDPPEAFPLIREQVGTARRRHHHLHTKFD